MKKNTFGSSLLTTTAKYALGSCVALTMIGGMASQAEAGQIKLSLSGMCGDDIDCVNGVGATGMFIGKFEQYASHWKKEKYNWLWNDVSMKIDTETGDASITGKMTSAVSNPNKNGYGEVLDVNIALTGMTFQGDAFSGDDPYDDMIKDLMNNGDRASDSNLITKHVDAINWSELTMSFNGDTYQSIPKTGWEGMKDDNTYYCDGCVAQLAMMKRKNGETDIHFGAWYKNDDPKYNFADTKAKAMVHKPAKTPEPATLGSLFLIAGGVAASRRRKSNSTAVASN